MTSQLFKWYEEGTWVPIITSTGGGSGQIYSTQSGTYTRVGNLVLARFAIQLSSAGTLVSGVARLGGFPFAFSDGNTPVTFSYWSGIVTASYAIYAESVSGQTYAEFLMQTAATTASANLGMSPTEVSNTFRVAGTIAYMTS